MTTLSKDEVVEMAREAGFSQDWQFAVPPATLSNFAALCRAPLVEENAALKEQLKALGVYNESTKAELARVRAVEPFGWYSAKEDDFMLDKIRKTHERLNSHTHRIGKYDLALYTTPPQPAAQEPTSAVPVVEQFLQDGDQHLLHSFIETTEDDEGYMLTKPEIKRLAELGVVQSHGFGKYSVTMFGHWVHERYWHQNPSIPLKTNTDRTADAAIAAGQKFIKESGK